MTRMFYAAAAALFVCGVAVPADAAKKNARGGPSTKSATIECMKQYGAWYDPATKRWTMQGPTHYMASRADAVDSCVAQRTKQPVRAVMQERTIRY
ncbi:MAG: hypothetical protein AB1490_10620 [Pseudomonadota bacterium]